MKNSTSESWRVLAPFALARLPENISERVDVLRALVQITPDDSECKDRIAILLQHLEDHIAYIAKAQLTFKFDDR